MNKSFFIISFLLIFWLTSYAQTDFIPGYIQLTKTDTIFGFIENRADVLNYNECNFKRNLMDTVRIFNPLNIYGYRFIAGKCYVSKSIKDNGNQKAAFLECMVEGVLNLYYYSDSKDLHYYIDKHDLPLKEISYPNEIIYKDGDMFERKDHVNKNVLKFYMQDCPMIYSDIDALNIPSHKLLIGLVKKYHDLHCPNEVCLIYQKKLPKFRIDIQPIFGMTYLSSDLYYLNPKTDKYTSQYGLLAYLWLPLVNEKLFLKTGIIFNHVNGFSAPEYQYDKTNLISESGIKIPIQLHYQFFKGDFTPVISGGVNVYSTPGLHFGALPVLSIGCNLKIEKNIYASLLGDTDCVFDGISNTDNSIFKIGSYSINLGVAIKL